MVSVVYAYHFVSIIIGMNQYVHYTRFSPCNESKDFLEATEKLDGPLLASLLFHIIEWVRQMILITTILVGVKWLWAYFILSINIVLYFVGTIWAIVAGFGADDDCKNNQEGRVGFL